VEDLCSAGSFSSSILYSSNITNKLLTIQTISTHTPCVSSYHTTFRRIKLLSFISILIANRYYFNTRHSREFTGNEEADEWAKISVEGPDTRGVEWLNYSDRTKVGRFPSHDRSPSSSGRSRRRSGGGATVAAGQNYKTKHRMPKRQRLDDTIAGSTKRPASRIYQIKTGH